MLSAVNLRKVFVTKEKQGAFRSRKKEVVAVKNLDLEIRPGEIVGLLGINGAGKTTTIKMLSTLLVPTAGNIVIDDHRAKRWGGIACAIQAGSYCPSAAVFI